jgi:hypothetical protein
VKVIFLNTYDSGGGAAHAAFRLHKGIQNIGIDSRMLVQIQTMDEKTILGPANKIAEGLAVMRTGMDSLFLKLYPKHQATIFSSAMIPDCVTKKVAGYDPDIIHLHWISHGFLRLETLKKFNRPLLWTLHDSWAFTGGCHIPFECTRYRQRCGKCPALGSAYDHDISRWIWRRKQKAWRDLNLTVVAPSRWMAIVLSPARYFTISG